MRSFGISYQEGRPVRETQSFCVDIEVECLGGILRTLYSGLQEEEKKEDGCGRVMLLAKADSTRCFQTSSHSGPLTA